MRRLCTAAFISFLLCSAARLEAAAVRDAHVTAELVTDAVSLEPGQTFWVAVRLVTDPGWHIYWKNPGDSGLATSVEWKLPPGFEPAGELRWPAPRAFDDGNATNYGYTGETFLFLPVHAPETLPAGPLTLAADVKWIACQEICIPGGAHLDTPLPADAAAPGAFTEALSRLPLTESTWRITMLDTPARILFRLFPSASGKTAAGVRFLAEDPSVVRHAGMQFFRKDQNGFYELSVPKAESGIPAPLALKGLLISKDGWEGPDSSGALEINLTTQT